MKKDILVFSKFFGYNHGGAERSIYQQLLDWEGQGHRIHVLFVEDMNFLGAANLKMELPTTWSVRTMRFVTRTNRLIYLQYFLNKKRIQKIFSIAKPEYTLLSYGFFAPAAINAYKGESIYSVRDEYGLGWNKNYYRGFKRFLKSIYVLWDLPFYYGWKKELKQCLDKAELHANSNFIARHLRAMSGKEITVTHPMVPVDALKKKFMLLNKESSVKMEEKGIIMIGNNIIKGSDIFFKLARSFLSEHFYIFDRVYKKRQEQKISSNVFYMPWESDVINVYRYAKVVLLPARWYEAFSRVALESSRLNILLLASNRGGIAEAVGPEAIKSGKAILIDEVDNINKWRDGLKKLLALY